MIRGYHAALDADAVGAGHVVLVQVLLSSTTEQDLRRFNEAVRRIPEIESCHMIAGDFDYLLKVRTRDINEYRKVMGEHISGLPSVKQTHTYVVMEGATTNSATFINAEDFIIKLTGLVDLTNASFNNTEDTIAL